LTITLPFEAIRVVRNLMPPPRDGAGECLLCAAGRWVLGERQFMADNRQESRLDWRFAFASMHQSANDTEETVG